MKRSRLIIPLVALATMALMLSAVGASAVPHQTVGESTTECDVEGSVTLSPPGVSVTPSFGTYTFQQAELDCTGKKGDVYDVEAEGDTTDSAHQGIGETCADGGSVTEVQEEDGSTDVHSGVLVALGNTKNMIGEVHFVRAAEVVLADGPLWDGFDDPDDLPEAKQNEPDQWFQAQLVFEPTQGDCVNGVTTADLTGDAQIYNHADVDAHVCGDDALMKDDKPNHCF